MALTVATGFVVDDAIVVLENITRHIEAGMPRMQAALLGAREVGFTVLSMSLSLIAVFIPILLMGGIVGRLFREFAVTLSVAILVSLVVSLTTTPMMCARLLRPSRPKRKPRPASVARSERVFDGAAASATSARCGWALDHPLLDHADPAGDDLPQRLSLRHRAEGLLPAAGHRPADRRHPGRPEHLVPAHAAEADAVHRDRAGRSGGRHRGRLHRRRRRPMAASSSSR